MEIPDLKPSYADLERRVRALDEESRRRHKVEQILRRQNAYLSALHDTTLGLVNRREKEPARKKSGCQPGARKAPGIQR